MNRKEILATKEFVLGKVNQCRILVVGDVMLDKYYFGEVKRISPEAPVPITRVIRQKEALGGAANVAHNLSLLGCQTFLAGIVGDDIHCLSLETELKKEKIYADGLIKTKRPTTTKLRVMGGHQQMLRLDFEENHALETEYEISLIQYISDLLKTGINCVIISDYAKGVCTYSFCQQIIQLSAMYQVPVIIDPKGDNWSKYKNADYLTPNLKELNEVLTESIINKDEAVKTSGQIVKRKFKIKNIIVTRSERGLSLIGNRQIVHIPTVAQEVFDVSGAGDTVIAVFGASISAGLSPKAAASLANIAAGIVVGKLGTYAVSREELLQKLEELSRVEKGE